MDNEPVNDFQPQTTQDDVYPEATTGSYTEAREETEIFSNRPADLPPTPPNRSVSQVTTNNSMTCGVLNASSSPEPSIPGSVRRGGRGPPSKKGLSKGSETNAQRRE